MPYLLLFLLLALAACDVDPVTPDPDEGIARGSFSALLNGEPWAAAAAYSSYDGVVSFGARRIADDSYYTQSLGIEAIASDLAVGDLIPISGYDEATGQLRGVRVFEGDGDSVIQEFRPAAPESGRIAVTARTDERLTISLEVVLVAQGPPNAPYQRLPDTLRFTAGEFVFDLNAAESP